MGILTLITWLFGEFAARRGTTLKVRTNTKAGGIVIHD